MSTYALSLVRYHADPGEVIHLTERVDRDFRPRFVRWPEDRDPCFVVERFWVRPLDSVREDVLLLHGTVPVFALTTAGELALDRWPRGSTIGLVARCTAAPPRWWRRVLDRALTLIGRPPAKRINRFALTIIGDAT